MWIIIRHNPKGGEKNFSKESVLRDWYTGSYKWIANAKTGHIDKRGFRNILDENPREFDGLKELAEELRMAIFPIRHGALFTGTYSNSNKVYTPIVEAFDRAIVKWNDETG